MAVVSSRAVLGRELARSASGISETETTVIQATADIAINPADEVVQLGPLGIRFLVTGHESRGSASVFGSDSTAALAATVDACCEMFKRIPMPIKFATNDDPPLLTNGNGMPFGGTSPSTTLMLKSACTATIIVSPSARSAPNRSGATKAVRNPRQAITAKQTTMIVVPRSPSSSPITAKM